MKKQSPFVTRKKLERAFDIRLDDEPEQMARQPLTGLTSSELEFAQTAQNAGWTPFKTGWPDFLCMRARELICVEVKAARDIPLTDAQMRIARLLSRHGIRCFKWSPDGGFERLFKAEFDASQRTRYKPRSPRRA